MTKDVNNPKHIGRIHKIPCLKCDNTTRHEVLACAEDRTDTDEMVYWEEYEILSCCGCGQVSFRENWQSSEELDYDEEERMEVTIDHPSIYPPRVPGRRPLKRDHELPSTVRAIYLEVHKAIVNGQPVLAGIGIRALIEAVCEHQGATGGNLVNRIDALAKNGVLTLNGAKILHEARLLGNKAAHEVAPPTESELDALIEIAEQLLVNVYIHPTVTAAIRKPKKSTP